MAAAKMNTLHWHITDSNMVPIESKLFPDLNKKGAYNPVTMVYTQEQVKLIVDYARHRGIRVVPEFDMPAHADAWALGAPAGTMVRCPDMKVWSDTMGLNTQGIPLAYFDPTSEVTYSFIDAFIGEMATLFHDQVTR
jgi:hexosaminidase